MVTRIRRLELATAILWIGFGAGGWADAGPIALSTPAGLSPGESFRFVFVTDGTTDASSSSIAYYNNFVNTQAGGATYNGSVVTWGAIASTPTVNAIDNVGQTLTPVYLADGTLVTTSTTSLGMWSGSLLAAISEDLSGNPPNAILPVPVWTGTYPDGFPDPYSTYPQTLGGGYVSATFGTSGHHNSEWTNAGSQLVVDPAAIYGISQVLVATGSVPEPSSLLMAGTAISAGCAFGWSRRRKNQRRQRTRRGEFSRPHGVNQR